MISRPIALSAFVEDMRVDALPQKVRDDIARFITAKDHHLIPHYGMVVKELVAKADPANMKSARAHVRKISMRQAMKGVLNATSSGEKYVLLLNDRIIDGHHFLAKAERGKVTSSLNVLDLTPARFQFRSANPLVTMLRARFDNLYQDPAPAPKSQRSGWRTAATVAGGGGLGYAGYEVGRAARSARETIARVGPNVEAAAANAAAVTGAVRKVGAPFKKLRKIFKMSTPRPLRKDGQTIRFAFGGASVAQDRYRKAIHEHEANRAESNYTRSALVGGALGAVLRKPGVTRGKAGLIGAAAGIATQAAVRTATAPTKDQFGDRPLASKRLEKLPWQAGAVAAGALGWRRLKGRGLAFRTPVRKNMIRFGVVSKVRWAAARVVNKARTVLTSAEKAPVFPKAAGLGAGIAAADVLASAALPEHGQSRTQAAGRALARGAVYGGGLVAAEPLITIAAKRLRLAAKQGRIIRFTSDLEKARGASVTKAKLGKYGMRTGKLAGDALSAARGVRPVDKAGRPERREWDKPWFHSAVGKAAVAGASAAVTGAAWRKRAVVGAAISATMMNPKVRRGVADGVERVAGAIVRRIRPS